METLSEQILRENHAVFQAMLDHRFVEDILRDRLPGEVFDRYLVFEGAFVETAIAIFSYAVAKAPGMPQRRWLVSVLDALANEQIAYFEDTFTKREIDAHAFDTGRPEVVAFRNGMLTIAEQGSFPDILAIMFAAEWMYWTWCSRAAEKTITDPFLGDWVRLHAAPAFKSQAFWLRDELDSIGAELGQKERTRASELFGRAMALEIAFHEAPYRD